MFPKKCKKLPSAPTSRADAQDYASVIGRALRAELGYEYERDDNSEFHLLRVGMTWTF